MSCSVWLKIREKFRWKLETKFMSHSQVNTLHFVLAETATIFSALDFGVYETNDDDTHKKCLFIFLLAFSLLYNSILFFSASFRLSFLYSVVSFYLSVANDKKQVRCIFFFFSFTCAGHFFERVGNGKDTRSQPKHR